MQWNQGNEGAAAKGSGDEAFVAILAVKLDRAYELGGLARWQLAHAAVELDDPGRALRYPGHLKLDGPAGEHGVQLVCETSAVGAEVLQVGRLGAYARPECRLFLATLDGPNAARREQDSQRDLAAAPLADSGLRFPLC